MRDHGKRLLVDVFIDGFNLEFGAMRPAGLHWINLRRLAERITPRHYGTVDSVFLYTAPLLDRKGCVGVATKQDIWFRALSATNAAQVVLGHHVRQLRSLPRAEPGGTEGSAVKVVQPIEKGSDDLVLQQWWSNAEAVKMGPAHMVKGEWREIAVEELE